MSDTFKIKGSRDRIRLGFGVFVDTLWSGGEDEGTAEYVSDIVVSVCEVSPESVRMVGGVPCVPIPGCERAYMPTANFQAVPDLTEDDTHDLRSRWFATREAADEHAASVERSWARPLPWVSFVRL